MKRIYIAGPWVFRPKTEDFKADVRALLYGSGMEPVFPTDGLPDGTAIDVSSTTAIQSHCLSHLDSCDAILAEVSPWYGYMPDSGTVFEIGYAAAGNKQVFLWTLDDTPLWDRLIAADRMVLDAHGNGTHDRDGNLVEDFGSPVNAMLAVDPTYRSLREACEAILGMAKG
ncbi:nucleoside 2-deoxyribosyltransferase [Acidithiobacillus sp. MC6.1]|nr:nucleoside 2-deoxyribosyltransferase [Acidithiobacillus sp. MC6.1]